MSVVAFIVALASTLVLAAVVGWLFYWAAREDFRDFGRKLGLLIRFREPRQIDLGLGRKLGIARCQQDR